MIDRIKEILSYNLFWKLFALLFAIVLWYFCMNITNPNKNKTVYVDLKVRGEEILEQNDMVLLNEVNERVTIHLNGPQDTLNKIKEVNDPNIEAFIELSDVALLNTANMGKTIKAHVNVVYSGILNPINSNHSSFNSRVTPQMADITLDVLEERKFDINVIKGEAKSPYHALDPIKEPEEVTIKGPKTLLSQIKSANVNVDLEDKVEDFTIKTAPTVIGYNNSEITDVNIDPEQVSITIPIRMTKRMPIAKPDYIGTPADGYVYVDMDYSPKFVEVYGTEEALNSMQQININENNTIDITGKTDTTEDPPEEYDLRDYLEGTDIYIMNKESSQFYVKPIIEKRAEKVFDIPSMYLNKDNESIQFLEDNISVKIEGATSIISDVTVSKIKGYIETSELDPGEHEVQINFNLPNNVKIVGESPTVRLIIPE